MKPIINLDEVTEFNEINRGKFSAKMAPISSMVGARRLGYNVTIVPAGKTAFPRHNHRVNEELFFVLEGSGILRFGNHLRVAKRDSQVKFCFKLSESGIFKKVDLQRFNVTMEGH
jgi:uncharacterized cupin superfamily protein